jgi:hypothetical protein
MEARCVTSVKINDYLPRELPVTEVQLDELWNFVERKKAQLYKKKTLEGISIR